MQFRLDFSALEADGAQPEAAQSAEPADQAQSAVASTPSEAPLNTPKTEATPGTPAAPASLAVRTPPQDLELDLGLEPLTAEDAEPAFAFDVNGPSRVIHSDNLPVLKSLPDGAFRVVYFDPPFNTRRTRRAERVRGVKAPLGEPGRLGFRGQGYQITREMTFGFDDRIHEYWDFLEARLEEAWRLLAEDGTLYLHLDYREVHYAKVLLDAMFGPECFINEIIWAYDYGARTKKRWPTKHDNILVYAKDPEKYFFNSEEVDREPYMAPGLVTPEKAALGKLPTDTWWHTIVSPTGKERTGYPTQKPVGILRRIVQASSRPGDWVLDGFAGSGTTGAAAHQLGRKFVLIDDNPESYTVMRERFAGTPVEFS